MLITQQSDIMVAQAGRKEARQAKKTARLDPRLKLLGHIGCAFKRSVFHLDGGSLSLSTRQQMMSGPSTSDNSYSYRAHPGVDLQIAAVAGA